MRRCRKGTCPAKSYTAGLGLDGTSWSDCRFSVCLNPILFMIWNKTARHNIGNVRSLGLCTVDHHITYTKTENVLMSLKMFPLDYKRSFCYQWMCVLHLHKAPNWREHTNLSWRWWISLALMLPLQQQLEVTHSILNLIWWHIGYWAIFSSRGAARGGELGWKTSQKPSQTGIAWKV